MTPMATLLHSNSGSESSVRHALDIPILQIVGCIALAFALTGGAVLLAKYLFAWMA
jgi:hypothetical protein